MSYYFQAMRNYAVFRGRATRAEFWYFTLIYMIVLFMVVLYDQHQFGVDRQGSGVITSLFALVHALPGTALLVRRLHDTDRTGWWALINITGIGTFVLLAFAMMRGTEGPNRFGPPPTDDFADSDVHFPRDRPASRNEPSMEERPRDVASGQIHSHSDTRRDPIDDIERLAALRSSGGITDAEFEVMKARALDAGRL